MRHSLLLLCLVAFKPVFCQVSLPDSVPAKQLDDIVVTATRTERPMGAVPLPVTVIQQRQIQAMGSLRLGAVLAEQTGLAVVNDHGPGIQVQGFGPDYTLILLNGEPLIGRTAGTLDLNRLAVGNIKRIEIVKGPSSSLYGSEALAGVINIITDVPTKSRRASFSARYGANQTSDLAGDLGLTAKKFSLYAFANRYASGGYTVAGTPTSSAMAGPTVMPFQAYTTTLRLNYTFSPAWQLSVSGRYYTERQDNEFSVAEPATLVAGLGRVQDWNMNPVLTHRPSAKWKLNYRFYGSRYQTRTVLNDQSNGQLYDDQFFNQTFNRPEIQAEFIPTARHIFTAGVGYIAESVEATRYTDRKTFGNRYVFAQYEWLPTHRWTVIAGGRFDAHSQYASQFSPKLSAQYDLTKSIALRGSVGVGFKAPDFRQLYLNFGNAVVGYSVFGAQEVAAAVSRLQAAGQIAEILTDLSRFGNIRAESSRAVNLGARFKSQKLPVSASINVFRNDIRDLIDTQPVAIKTNGQNVFSYINLNQVYTQGVEVEGSWQVALGPATTTGSGGQLTISSGYQYLDAKDKSIIDQLNRGEIFRRSPETLVTERVRLSEYGGLLNRSRHMANIKFFYELPKQKLTASLRGIYRGRYGFADRNGNTIIDADNEYVKGYMTWNIAASKTIKAFTLQAGLDNLFGYTDPVNIPNLPGRLWYASVRWNLIQLNP